jgi:hypothetical protein
MAKIPNCPLGYTWVYQLGQVSLLDTNGTTRFKNLNNCLNTNISSYLETSVGQISNLHLNAVYFFNTSVNWTYVGA